MSTIVTKNWQINILCTQDPDEISLIKQDKINENTVMF